MTVQRAFFRLFRCPVFLRFDDYFFAPAEQLRKNQYKSFAAPFEQYEVLIGKIADDDTSQVINAYMQGVFGFVGSESAIHIAKQRFLTNRLKNQICLKSEKALQKLEFVESQIVTL